MQKPEIKKSVLLFGGTLFCLNIVDNVNNAERSDADSLFPQAGVLSISFQQILVRTALDNGPTVQDQDLIRIHDG